MADPQAHENDRLVKYVQLLRMEIDKAWKALEEADVDVPNFDNLVSAIEHLKAERDAARDNVAWLRSRFAQTAATLASIGAQIDTWRSNDDC